MEDAELALAQAIEIVGGAAKVAEHFGISSQAVSQWKRCPPDRVLALEALVAGRVTRYRLRADIFGSAPEAAAAMA